MLVVGTYTENNEKSLYTYYFDSGRQTFTEADGVSIVNPSYVTSGPLGNRIYAVTENTDRPSYANFLILEEKNARLTVEGRHTTQGAGPCYITVDPCSRFVVTANYAGGSLSVFPLDKDGGLKPLAQLIGFTGRGPNPERQEASHIHCAGFPADGKYLFATDLGADRIYRFDVDLTGGERFLKEETLKEFSVKPGSGPRHFVFSPDGRFFYLISELAGTVSAFGYRNGNIELIQEIEVEGKATGDGGDIVMTPDGRYLYASMREGYDGIGAFSVDHDSGKLGKIEYIRTPAHPRNLAVSPDGMLLTCAAMKDNVINLYAIDQATGRLQRTDAGIRINSPACVRFIDCSQALR